MDPVKTYEGYIRALAKSIAKKHTVGDINLEVLFQEGIIALLTAKDTEDKKARIERCLLEYVSGETRQQRLKTALFKDFQKFQKVRESLFKKFKRSPTIKEIAENSDLSMDKLEQLEKMYKVALGYEE